MQRGRGVLNGLVLPQCQADFLQMAKLLFPQGQKLILLEPKNLIIHTLERSPIG